MERDADGTVRTIEEIAANAWPALITQTVDGWRLRATPSVEARRANSVLPLEGRDDVGLEEKLSLVERFYARYGLPIRYQISAAARPADLDTTLERLGYSIEAPVDVQTAWLADVMAARPERFDGDAEISQGPTEDWIALWTQLFHRGDPATTRRAILNRIAPATAYVLVRMERQPAAVGMGVAEREWLGVFAMGTAPELRRRGAGRAVLSAIAEWGQKHGARRGYLQVEAKNEAAHALYESAGFETTYGYHYRTRT